MKNVTLSLDERTLSRARKQAAEQNTSLSKMIGDLLEASIRQSRAYEQAMGQYLSRGPVTLNKRGAAYPSRDESHDRTRLR